MVQTLEDAAERRVDGGGIQMRIELTYLSPRGTMGHENITHESKVIEVSGCDTIPEAEALGRAWLVIQEQGFFFGHNKTVVPASAVISVRKSDWKGRI